MHRVCVRERVGVGAFAVVAVSVGRVISLQLVISVINAR